MNFIKEVTSEEIQLAWQESENFNSALFAKLPTDIVWASYEVFKVDVSRIFHINSSNWKPITDWTHRVEMIYSRIDLQPEFEEKSHLDFFREHKQNIQNLLAKNVFEDPIKGLILIATDLNGPLTIYDGNHRFAAHFIKNVKRDEDYIICNKAYVGISKNLNSKDHFLYTE